MVVLLVGCAPRTDVAPGPRYPVTALYKDITFGGDQRTKVFVWLDELPKRLVSVKVDGYRVAVVALTKSPFICETCVAHPVLMVLHVEDPKRDKVNVEVATDAGVRLYLCRRSTLDEYSNRLYKLNSAFAWHVVEQASSQTVPCGNGCDLTVPGDVFLIYPKEDVTYVKAIKGRLKRI